MVALVDQAVVTWADQLAVVQGGSAAVAVRLSVVGVAPAGGAFTAGDVAQAALADGHRDPLGLGEGPAAAEVEELGLAAQDRGDHPGRGSEATGRAGVTTTEAFIPPDTGSWSTGRCSRSSQNACP